MKILMVAAEVGPYVSVGGLSQVLYFLPKALVELGHDVRIFTPKFGLMDTAKKKWKLKTEVEGIEVGGLICNVKSHFNRLAGMRTYFLENREYYELRANVFGYKDDHTRFALLCKGALTWLARQKASGGWWPDVIHCHDWHAAYLIEWAKRDPDCSQMLAGVPIVLTVHNFGYQGNYDFAYCPPEERDNLRAPLYPLLDPRLQRQNALMRGILYADYVTTVSPTHAKEMLTPEYAEALYPLMKRVERKLGGILNGLDDEEFDPRRDKRLYRHFDSREWRAARQANKRHLQKLFGLPRNEETFLLAYSGRLVAQKGIDQVIEASERLLSEYPDIQLVVLGGGDDGYRRRLTKLQEKYAKQIGLYLMPNFRLPRKIFAGADALLMPSRFEPGGIVALEAMRYGAVPIVRRTGGLNDIVRDFEIDTGRGNGFSIDGASAWSLYGAVVSARTIFRGKKLWTKLVKNALESDFSWRSAAIKYQKWYEVAIETKPGLGRMRK